MPSPLMTRILTRGEAGAHGSIPEETNMEPFPFPGRRVLMGGVLHSQPGTFAVSRAKSSFAAPANGSLGSVFLAVVASGILGASDFSGI